jgi:hypothetical protein
MPVIVAIPIAAPGRIAFLLVSYGVFVLSRRPDDCILELFGGIPRDHLFTFFFLFLALALLRFFVMAFLSSSARRCFFTLEILSISKHY